MNKEDLNDIVNYYEKREKYEKTIYGKLTHEQRLKIHCLLLKIICLKNKLSGFNITKIKDDSEITERPKIFCITHIGKYDIEVISEVIKEHYYLLSGDFENIYGTIEEKFLGFNGVVYVREDDKKDRKLSKEKMINILKNNGNIMYFPEGTWNLSPNLPVVKCSYGIIDVAMKSNAIIVPIAIEQYGKNFISAIGKNFDVNNYSENDKELAIEDLRSAMATLKWEIWENVSPNIRSEISEKDFDNFIGSRLKEWPNFTLEEFLDRVYKPKNIVEEKEVYEFLTKINLNYDNAFLAKSKHEYEKKYIKR